MAAAYARSVCEDQGVRRLMVDGMNVIGSRPDGWWRDRDGAVRRLLARLQELAASTGDDVTLVLDGRPLPDVPAAGATPPTTGSSSSSPPTPIPARSPSSRPTVSSRSAYARSAPAWRAPAPSSNNAPRVEFPRDVRELHTIWSTWGQLVRVRGR
jgi:hypothetical protein